MPSPIRASRTAVLLMALTCLAAEDGALPIGINAQVPRSLDDVKAANFAYGPKQTVDPATGETCVYLPYGNNPKLYWQPVRGTLSDAGADSLAEYVSSPGGAESGALTYKLVLNKAITGFRFAIGYAELVLDPDCVAGLEYSTDGTKWTVARELKGANSVVSPFPGNVDVRGLDTRVLFLRVYARNANSPTATSGSGMYLKMRISGNASWGDAATTFFDAQPRVWLKAK